MEFSFFMFGLFFVVFLYEILKFFVEEDYHSFFVFRFFDWVEERAYDRYLEKKIKETRYSIYLSFRCAGKDYL